ncbi:MAG: PVC-type heme-binding CxxCH protein [Bacteroidota bacterium]
MKKVQLLFSIIIVLLALLVASAYLLLKKPNAELTLNQSEPTTREYTLQAYTTGYIGVGGEIEGIRNPVLRAQMGDSVRITMINGETMTHDIKMEKQGAHSDPIVEKGTLTSISFVAMEDDIYFCTVPGHQEVGMEGKFEISSPSTTEAIVEGVIPQKNDEPLNLDFEYAHIRGWTTVGEAFNDQPVADIDTAYYGKGVDPRSSGQFYVNSGGTKQHAKVGTLTSEPFEITHPFASFRVAGGALQEARVELVLSDTDSVFFTISGNNHERLRPVVVDLTDYQDQSMYIRLIDNETGIFTADNNEEDVWAHISFDDFRFYASRPDFPNELRPDEIVLLPPFDIIKHAGLTGEEAAKEMELPDDFSITLAAGEPEVIRPIAITLDDRNRVWIAEAHTYPQKAPEGEGKDRILIFEDTNGDGKLNKRTIFKDGLNLVSGLEIGHGGVWVGAAPYLMYIPIDESGDQPAGEPQILLDGWGYQDTHETLSSFRWGPDGWLYGTTGITTRSNIGKPGASDDEREKLNVGVWRYHPTEHQFEVYARGISNLWGLDFNEYGHMFVSANILPHLWHIIPGAWYRRQFGEHNYPYVYDDIKTVADHVHWVGNRGSEAGNGRSGSVGGGHSHAGAMFYLGAEHWPEEYRDYIFMNNIHGNRVNVDLVERRGSGYVGIHREDFLLTHDAWSQWLDFRFGPSGSVYAIDWYDKNQCHHTNEAIHDKTLGRIFKISHKDDEFVQIDLSEKSSTELVEYQLHTNEWYVRHARRLLQERGPDEAVYQALREMLDSDPNGVHKLRALWSLHVTEGLTNSMLMQLLDHDDEYLRGWAVQLAAEDKQVSEDFLAKFATMAGQDNSALVRLQLASVLQRIPEEQRWDILEALNTRSEDAQDHNIPLMVWYAFEPLVELDPERAARLAEQSTFPNLLDFTSRRLEAVESPTAQRVLERLAPLRAERASAHASLSHH